MIELAVTSARTDVLPAIRFDELYHLPYLHLPNYSAKQRDPANQISRNYAKSRSSNRISAKSIATAEYSTQYSSAHPR